MTCPTSGRPKTKLYTIRNVPRSVDRALRQMAREKRKSLNAVLLEAVSNAVNVAAEPTASSRSSRRPRRSSHASGNRSRTRNRPCHPPSKGKWRVCLSLARHLLCSGDTDPVSARVLRPVQSGVGTVEQLNHRVLHSELGDPQAHRDAHLVRRHGSPSRLCSLSLIHPPGHSQTESPYERRSRRQGEECRRTSSIQIPGERRSTWGEQKESLG